MTDKLKVEYKNGPIDLSEHIDLGVGNIITSLAFGFRFDEVGETFPFFKQASNI